MTASALTRKRYASMARSVWSAWPSERVSCMGGFPSSRIRARALGSTSACPSPQPRGLLRGCQKTRSPMNRRPRVLLADDHTMLLDAFRRLLEPRCEIVGTACDGRALLELAAKTQPDVIVLDIGMPRLNGMDACAQLRRKMPGVRLVFLTVNEDPDIAAEAIRLGASGYLLKNSASGELFTASSRRSRARPTSRRSSPRACLSAFSSAGPRSLPRRSSPPASAKCCNSSRKAAR